MASVTFPVDLGGSGVTITDDTNPTTGLAAGGHRQRFVPALAQSVVMARTAQERARYSDNARLDSHAAMRGAQLAENRTKDVAASVDNHKMQAEDAATKAANSNTAALSAAQSANNSMLALGAALINGLGAFTVNVNGELVVDYNTGSISNITVDAGGFLQITYQ